MRILMKGTKSFDLKCPEDPSKIPLHQKFNLVYLEEEIHKGLAIKHENPSICINTIAMVVRPMAIVFFYSSN